MRHRILAARPRRRSRGSDPSAAAGEHRSTPAADHARGRDDDHDDVIDAGEDHDRARARDEHRDCDHTHPVRPRWSRGGHRIRLL